MNFTSKLVLFQEYILADVRDRQHLITLHKKAKKLGLDLNQYNQLKDQIRQVELDLRKLRDPLRLHLPPKPLLGPARPADDWTTKEDPSAKKGWWKLELISILFIYLFQFYRYGRDLTGMFLM